MEQTFSSGRNPSFDAFVLSAGPSAEKAPANSTAAAAAFGAPQTKKKSGKSNTQRACERCRKQRLKCEEGRPCKRCRSKTLGQPCTDCDPLTAEASTATNEASPLQEGPVSVMDVVCRPLSSEGRMLILPEPTARQIVRTKFDTVSCQMGGGAWVSHRFMSRMAEGMPDDLVDAVIEALEAVRISTAAMGLMDSPAP
eukprot:2156071-Rhodomonas_salina.1